MKNVSDNHYYRKNLDEQLQAMKDDHNLYVKQFTEKHKSLRLAQISAKRLRPTMKVGVYVGVHSVSPLPMGMERQIRQV